MKKLTVLLASLLSFSAHAEETFYAPNQAGGYIELSDEHTGCVGNWFRYQLTDQNGTSLGGGCYRYFEPWIRAVDDNGVVRQWAIGGFTPTEYAKARYGRRN